MVSSLSVEGDGWGGDHPAAPRCPYGCRLSAHADELRHQIFVAQIVGRGLAGDPAFLNDPDAVRQPPDELEILLDTATTPPKRMVRPRVASRESRSRPHPDEIPAE
jgi:hypothetical protein